MKTCKYCNVEKPLTDFYFVKQEQRYEVKCKECKKERWKNLTDEQREKKRLQNLKYYYNNKEKVRAKVKIYSQSKTGIEKRKKRINTYYVTNPNFKLRKLLSYRIWVVLKGVKKADTTKNLTGCSMQQLKKHLESQFKKEMNWENHGKIWEIDHILPCNSFDLTDEEQQKKCFHYSNLQPLFKTTEIAESFGYVDEIGNKNKSNKLI
jgi:hypothetical protein